MTPKEFKKQFPSFAHLEGDALWNKMEEMMLEGKIKPKYVGGIDPYEDGDAKSAYTSHSMIIWNPLTDEVIELKNEEE